MRLEWPSERTLGKERTINPSDFADADLVTLPSAHSAVETVERCKSLLRQKKIEVFAEPLGRRMWAFPCCQHAC